MKMWTVEHIHLDTEQGEGLTCDLMNGQTHGCEGEMECIMARQEEGIGHLTTVAILHCHQELYHQGMEEMTV